MEILQKKLDKDEENRAPHIIADAFFPEVFPADKIKTNLVCFF